MTVDGWVPVNPLTLETAFPGRLRGGDVTSVGTPRPESSRRARRWSRPRSSRRSVAARLTHLRRAGHVLPRVRYDLVARVTVTFLSGVPPVAEGSRSLAGDRGTRASLAPRAFAAGSIVPGPGPSKQRPDRTSSHPLSGIEDPLWVECVLDRFHDPEDVGSQLPGQMNSLESAHSMLPG